MYVVLSHRADSSDSLPVTDTWFACSWWSLRADMFVSRLRCWSANLWRLTLFLTQLRPCSRVPNLPVSPMYDDIPEITYAVSRGMWLIQPMYHVRCVSWHADVWWYFVRLFMFVVQLLLTEPRTGRRINSFLWWLSRFDVMRRKVLFTFDQMNLLLWLTLFCCCLLIVELFMCQAWPAKWH